MNGKRLLRLLSTGKKIHHRIIIASKSSYKLGTRRLKRYYFRSLYLKSRRKIIKLSFITERFYFGRIRNWRQEIVRRALDCGLFHESGSEAGTEWLTGRLFGIVYVELYVQDMG